MSVKAGQAAVAGETPISDPSNAMQRTVQLFKGGVFLGRFMVSSLPRSMLAHRFNLGGRIDPASSPAARLPWLDAGRAAAVVAMVVYHSAWDLRYFGFITADVESGGWRIFAHLIAASFLFIVGVGLVLSARRGFDAKRFLRRLAVIAAAAAAISVVTWFVARDTFVFFGILHHIAVASVIGLLFVRAPILVVIVASLLSFWAPALLSGPAFDAAALRWLGLTASLPRTVDFVPLFPWFGVVLAGIAVARLWPILVRGRAFPAFHERAGPLLWLGRHSLVLYLLHQPVLFGLAYVAAEVAPPNLLGFEPAYLEACVSSCVDSEVDSNVCRQTCDCLADRSQDTGLWTGLMRQSLSGPEQEQYYRLADECRAAAETQ